jgi:hypothetical protein
LGVAPQGALPVGIPILENIEHIISTHAIENNSIIFSGIESPKYPTIISLIERDITKIIACFSLLYVPLSFNPKYGMNK